MYYSLQSKLNKELIFYIVSCVLILLFVVLGIAGRKDKSEKAAVENTHEVSTSIPQEEKDGQISVYDHKTEKVMYMDIEEYVVGVVAKEMPASFKMEALKAQAVAARTIAYKYINQHSGCNGCDLCTSPGHVQGYAGIDDRKLLWGDEFEKWENVIKNAVYQTEGQVMTYKGELIDVLYHASSNGMTENSVEVFSDSRDYLVSVSSPDENLVKDEKVISEAQFASIVNSTYQDADLSAGKLNQQIKIKSYTQSGRVDTVSLGNVTIDGVSFRQLFSIKSTDFSFLFLDGNVVVSTLGYGHGVGMSQRGANELAKKGYSYGDILTHYYTGVSVVDYN